MTSPDTDRDLDPASFGPDDLPDLTGRRVVVTGGNSGIGFHAARALAAHGAHVTLACRDLDKARAAQVRLPGTTEVAELDLASLDSVRRFAAAWSSPLDTLVCNAGVMTPPRYRETADGFELQFGTNHLGHFALTGLLLPHLREARAPRVVPVASIAHHRGDASVLQGNQGGGRYAASHAYGNSKLANLLFAQELQRRAGDALTVSACHPGVSNTGLIGSRDGLGRIPGVRLVAPVIGRVFLQSGQAGANPTLWASTYAGPASYTGPQRFGEARGPLGRARLSAFARDEQLAAELWRISEERTGVSFDFA
ncbi:SDR family NAD(P)-dependent oxidoreductase [Nocardioides aequoreus]|uniref:SDR family NAD(P)-dependent oxidoreductase n=1 Tax=Nocardioides aequoreus TaxID=397278 RepID=UPI001B802A00|nr:SDR family NAD(P)-dependent oxidoreductase [Nocardioides aequoreus]